MSHMCDLPSLWHGSLPWHQWVSQELHQSMNEGRKAYIHTATPAHASQGSVILVICTISRLKHASPDLDFSQPEIDPFSL